MLFINSIEINSVTKEMNYESGKCKVSFYLKKVKRILKKLPVMTRLNVS